MDSELFNKYYLKVREDNAIIDAFSDGPNHEKSKDGYICFDKGGYQLRLNINGVETEENPPLYTDDGIPMYIWDGTKVVRRTNKEIASERASIPEPAPTEMEKMRADIDFLLAMEGV